MDSGGADHLFVAAVETIYDAALDPAHWPAALQAIADCFSDVGSILIWRRDDGTFGTFVSDSLTAAQCAYEREGWAIKELRALRTAERGYFFTGDAFTDRHICSEQEIRSDPVYRRFLTEHGLGWFAGVAVSPAPQVGVALSVQRNSRLKPPYSDRELQTLQRLGRHVEKSLRLSIRLFDAELANVGLGAALAKLGIGVFALDFLKRVVYRNPSAERLLGDGLAVINERLLVSGAAERLAFEQAIAQTLRRAPQDMAHDPKPILLPRQHAQRPLIVYVLPVTDVASAAEEFLTYTRAIVLVIDAEANAPADPAVVRDVLGLTLGEARVAALVGSGLPPREAAARLGITEETARTALKRAFSKTGVSRQSELTALLTKLVLR